MDEKVTKQQAFAKEMEDRARAKKRYGGASESRREYRLSIVPARVWESKRTIILEPPFARLSIDRYDDIGTDQGYQRGEIKPWVCDLADALRRGGQCPPIDVVKRAWESGNTLWIVDGQQRYLAHWDANKPLTANVYVVESRAEEIALFVVLNDRKRVSSSLAVVNHNGPSFDIIKAAALTPSHPLHERIHFREGGSGQRISIVSIVNALARYCGVMRQMNLRANLCGVDRFVREDQKNRERAEEFLRLVGIVFPKPTRPNSSMLLALARVLNGHGNRPVGSEALTKMRRTHLDRVKAATSKERAVLMKRRLETALYGAARDEE